MLETGRRELELEKERKEEVKEPELYGAAQGITTEKRYEGLLNNKVLILEAPRSF